MKDKIDEVCYDLELGCIDWKEASKQLFDLYVVSQRSELLLHAYKDGFNSATESLLAANKMVQDRKLQ